jgi:hypothetical protein
MAELSSGSGDIEGIARREKRSERYVRMVLPLAFLSPKVVSAAIEGRLPEGYGITHLSDQPLSWRELERDSG